jgi:hypothetical protein
MAVLCTGSWWDLANKTWHFAATPEFQAAKADKLS